jgi:cyclic pyranopterin phosphate synthase
MQQLTHFDADGGARMVDVSAKTDTLRVAMAFGRVRMNRETLELSRIGSPKKGDVLGTARIAGIMAAKRTWELIPMCHTVQLTGAELSLTINEEESAVDITATVRCKGSTGVEMEALTAVSVAALTVYDMLKAVQRDMEISDIKLLTKSGGKSGDYKSGGQTAQ